MKLTPDNLAEVERHVRTLGWIEPNGRIRELASAGEGNMNRTLRARLDSGSIVLKQAVPFVAKYPQIPAPIERLDVEAAFYQAIAGSPALADLTPKVLGYDPNTHLLCLEDLGTAGDFTGCYARTESPTKGNGRFEDIPIATLGGWLSALHNLALDEGRARQFDNRAMRELNHAHIFEIPLQRDNGLTPLRGTEALVAELSRDIRLKAAAKELGEIYLRESSAGADQVLLHGDFYPGSWLRASTSIRRNAPDIHIIDPEFAFVGAAEFDLGVWLAHLTFFGMADSELNRALATYSRRSQVDEKLVQAFAGMEVIRRLLGVARLPLQADASTLCTWLTQARDAIYA